MRFIKKYWMYLTILLLIGFSTYETIRANDLDKELELSQSELSDAQDKIENC